MQRVEDHTGAVHSVAIPPGYCAGVRLTYPNEEEEQKEAGAAVTYVVEEAKHPDFERRGDDLVHCATISLADALTECTVQVPTLDGKSVAVACDEVVRCARLAPGGRAVAPRAVLRSPAPRGRPGYERRIPGAGMPCAADPSRRGDLILRFSIEFPRHLDPSKRAAIRKLLQ